MSQRKWQCCMLCTLRDDDKSGVMFGAREHARLTRCVSVFLPLPAGLRLALVVTTKSLLMPPGCVLLPSPHAMHPSATACCSC